jgi:hypothetical protein
MILSTHGIVGSQIQSFVGLLDTYPNAAAAYSVRKLRAGYTGSAIKVRRSSDNTEQDIGFTALGNLDESALTTFCSGTNGFVTTWYDQSGNANNSTQTTAANQPQIVSSGAVITVNSKPATNFTNANTVGMDFTQLALTNFTILWVSKKATAVGSASIILTGLPGGANYCGDDVDLEGNPSLRAISTPVISLTTLNTSPTGVAKLNQHLAYLNRRSANQAVGQFNNSSNSYNNGTTNTFTIKSIALYGSGYNFVGNLQEIIIYSNDQSANRTGISNNINTYYAIY